MTGEMHEPPRRPYTPPGMRTSAEDRDRAVDVLKAAFGEGRLTRDELEARTERAMAAPYYSDLARVVEDLPGGGLFSAPPPPAPALYPRYYPGVQCSTNGFAIASLVTAVFGFFPVGVVLGHVAHGQIRRTGQHGSGLATAGLVIGYLGIAAWILMVIAMAAFVSAGPPG